MSYDPIRPVFLWDGELGPAPEGRPRRPRINRTEVLISPVQSDWESAPLYYGEIRNGMLYGVEVPNWRDRWVRALRDESYRTSSAWDGELLIRANYRGLQVEPLIEAHERDPSQIPPAILLSNRRYRFWVDWWLFCPDQDGVHHSIGDQRWRLPVPPAPTEDGWQVRTMPAASTDSVVLDCRRYAFLPRLLDCTSALDRHLRVIAERFAEVGVARSHLVPMMQLVGRTFDRHGSRISGERAPGWDDSGQYYDRIGRILREMYEISQTFMFEDPETRRNVRNANARAEKILDTLLPSSQLVEDLNAREEGTGNSDQVRDIVARAQLLLTKTPAPVERENLSAAEYRRRRGEITSRIQVEAPGRESVYRCYFARPGWAQRYDEEIYRPFVENGLAGDSWHADAARASPLFAARENLTTITNAIIAHRGTGEARQLAGRTFVYLRQQGLVRSGVTFQNAVDGLGDGTRTVEQIANPRAGMPRILLTSGLTLMIKTVVLADRWRDFRSRARPAPVEYLRLAQAATDCASATGSFTAGVAAEISSETARYRRLAGTAGRVGSVLGVVADTLDAGLYIYDEMTASSTGSDIYGSDYVLRRAAYHGVIAGGRVINAVGSALMCSAALAPIGLVVKAIGLGAVNLTQLAEAMDEMGEEEAEFCRRTWEGMGARCAEYRAFYALMCSNLRMSDRWHQVPVQFQGLSAGVDGWLDVPQAEMTAIRRSLRVTRAGS